MRKILVTCLLVGMGTMWSSSASALVLNGSGQVTDWNNIKPFTVPNGVGTVAIKTSVNRENNISPINYPEKGYVPSGGEKYDFEEIYARNMGNVMQVLLVTSVQDFKAPYNSVTFFLGDLMLDTNGDGAFDMGVVSHSQAMGLTGGQLYTNITTQGLQNLAGSNYGTASVETQIHNTPGQKAAMFVKSGTPVGPVHAVKTASYSYGKILGVKENNTWFYEYTFGLPGEVEEVNMQIGLGCGNDVIRLHHAVMPEPATMLMSLSAIGLLAGKITQRRNRVA